jgi:hypothetical protein
MAANRPILSSQSVRFFAGHNYHRSPCRHVQWPDVNISLMNYDEIVIIHGDIRLEMEHITTGNSKLNIKGVVRTS